MSSNRVWAIVDNNSSRGLPSAKSVIAKFDTLREANEACKQAPATEDWSIRVFNPIRRVKKDEAPDITTGDIS